MANNNNCYFNAALAGFLQGVLSGRKITGTTAGTYAGIVNAAAAFAGKVDAAIAFDALVTTANNDPTMLLADADHTKQSNTILRTDLLKAICAGVMTGSYSEDTTATDWTNLANACAAAFTQAAASLVSP